MRGRNRSTQTGRKRPKKRAPVKDALKGAKRKVSHANLPIQTHFLFGHEGRYFDLKEVFDRLNAKYFKSALKGYTITWGRRRKERPKTYFVFGTIQEEDKLIRVHPLLDQRWVPQWFLEFVVYHEMLHAVVPDRYDSRGRRQVHHEDFLKLEKKFPLYRRAEKWERENLERFLR